MYLGKVCPGDVGECEGIPGAEEGMLPSVVGVRDRHRRRCRRRGNPPAESAESVGDRPPEFGRHEEKRERRTREGRECWDEAIQPLPHHRRRRVDDAAALPRGRRPEEEGVATAMDATTAVVRRRQRRWVR